MSELVTPTSGAAPSERSERVLRSPRRLLLAGLGIVCVGLGALGVIVPGLPTTIFLILASYFFTRSCPWLEDRLIRNRVFSPYLRFLDGSRAMPRRARFIAGIAMWAAVAASLGLLATRDALDPWGGGAIVGAALVGSVVIARYRRG